VTGQPASTDAFDRFATAIKSEYPKQQPLQQASAKLQLGASIVHAEVPVSRIGVRAASADDKNVVIGSTRSLVVSRLKPYESWDALIERVKLLWPVYCEYFAPSRVVRVGVRCINHIELGDDSVDLDTVFTAGPKVPPDLPQGVGQYMTRVVLPIEADVGVSIAQTMEPLSGHVVLDIDAFSALDADAADAATLMIKLGELHDLRNRAFFASLYEHVWERYR
jgi:uncharacterized protein (TIGR04255 family)